MTSSKDQKRLNTSKLHLSDEQLIAIGQVAVRSAELDMAIEATMALLCNMMPQLMIDKISKFSTPKKLDLIGAYFTLHLPKKTKELKEFISAVHGARGERDDVIHRMWLESDNPDIKELWMLAKWPKFKHKRSVTAAWLRGLADRMDRFVWTMNDWYLEAMKEASAHPSQRNALLGKLLQQDSAPTGARKS